MNIAISGKSGCGNSTVSRIVADTLGLRLVNYTFRAFAAERGMSFEELRRQAEVDSSLDIALDNRQVELAREGDCVLGSRLAVWLLDDADLRVYLTAPLSVRAARIQRREGGSFQEVLRKTRARDERDRSRYLQLYGIDNDDFDFVDLVVDTQDIQPSAVAERVVAAARALRQAGGADSPAGGRRDGPGENADRPGNRGPAGDTKNAGGPDSAGHGGRPAG